MTRRGDPGLIQVSGSKKKGVKKEGDPKCKKKWASRKDGPT